jgi:DNA-binding SARP family transcriptional activator/tetratricopeptide (TPR) repeat protein
MSTEAANAIRLLGRPALRSPAGSWSDLPSGIAGAALCYVAFHSRPVTREELIALFWPEHEEPLARVNLRSLLWRLSRDPLVHGLERDRRHVRWRVETDSADLARATADARWRQAWGFIGGDLLEGFVVPRAPEFESWLELERAALRDLRRRVGMRLADEMSSTEQDDDAVEILSTLHRGDAYDEGVLRALMGVLARRGSRGDALATFGAFADHIADELGVEPEEETRALADAIRSGRMPGRTPDRTPGLTPGRPPGNTPSSAREPTGARAEPPAAVPVPATPLVGRRADLRRLQRLMEDPDCRLIVLVGPGGVGKTRLAVEVARGGGGPLHDRVAFVSLVTVSEGRAMLMAIGDAMIRQGGSSTRDEEAVVRALEASPTLLVLDNIEHLADAPALIARLLAASPAVRILATSRTTTGLTSEVTFDVHGLAVRNEAPASVAARRRRVEGASDAATLFAQVAGRVRSDFRMLPDDDEVVERICRLLGGSPLAIELAAAWVRALGVRDIEAALERGTDILHRDASEDGDRHASIRTVFEHSWTLLKPRERRALRMLSVCRGGFTLEAAREVAEIELPVLLALVNKSFLRRHGTGRYTRHPLVRQFTAARAAAHPAEAAAAGSRHAHYYLRHIATRVDAYHRPQGGGLMNDVALELENVIGAWRWATRMGDEAPLAAAVRSLGQFCWSRGRFDLMDELYTPALATASQGSLLRGRLLVGLGIPATWSDRGVDRRDGIVAGIRILENVGDDDDLAFAYRTLGIAHNRQRDWLGAEDAFEAGAREYERLGRSEGALMMIISRCVNAERVRESIARYEAVVTRARSANEPHPVAMALSGHSFMLRALGSYREALASHREAVELHDADRVPLWALEQRLNRADIELALGRWRYAQAASCGVIERCGRGGEDAFIDQAGAAMVLGARLRLLHDDAAGAVSWCERALEAHRRAHGTRRSFDRALTVLARAHLSRGRTGEAQRALEGADDGPDLRWWRGRHGDGEGSVDLATCRAELALARGDVGGATSALRHALEVAHRHELIAAALHALAVAPDVLSRRGASRRSEEVRDYARGHSRSPHEARVRAARGAGVGVTPQRPHVPRAPPDDGVDGVLHEIDAVLRALAD